MIASVRPWTAALAAALLAGCASGGGGVSLAPVAAPPAPPPAPPPSPPPSPPPTPSPPGSTFPGIAGSSFGGPSARIVAGAEVTIDASRRVTIVEIANARPARSGLENMIVTYLGPDSYALECCGFGGPSFTAENLVSPPASDIRQWRNPADLQYADNLELARTGEGMVLTYTGFGNVTSLSDLGAATPEAVIDFFAVGEGTRESGMPRTGTARYSGTADGLWIDGNTTRRLWGSKASFEMDFGAGTATTRLELVGRGDAFGDFRNAPSTPLGNFSGTGRISIGPMLSRFNGDFAAAAGYTGGFDGYFFGPGAEEVGMSFQLRGGPGQLVTGAAAGTLGAGGPK